MLFTYKKKALEVASIARASSFSMGIREQTDSDCIRDNKWKPEAVLIAFFDHQQWTSYIVCTVAFYYANLGSIVLTVQPRIPKPVFKIYFNTLTV